MRVSGEPARRACASPRRAVCSPGPLTASPRRGALTPGRWCNAAGAFCQAARAACHLAGAVVCSPRRGHCRPGEAAPPEPCLWAKTTCAGEPARAQEEDNETSVHAHVARRWHVHALLHITVVHTTHTIKPRECSAWQGGYIHVRRPGKKHERWHLVGQDQPRVRNRRKK